MNKYEQLSPESRVWIYQSNPAFLEDDLDELNTQLSNFSTHWVSHNQQLLAFAKVYHRQFIVLMVDESQAGASGCSIDKSVHFMKTLEFRYGVNLFDRMTFAVKKGDEILTMPKDVFAKEFSAGNISEETLVFDNLVKTKADFEKSWVKPISESWHKKFV